MSDIPEDWRSQIDIWAEIARIGRDQAEQSKLREESEKFIAEQKKLMAEARKFTTDRWLPPLALLVSSLGGGVIVALAQHLWTR